MFKLDTFYQSKEWRSLLDVIKHDRLDDNGHVICSYCNKPIVRSYDIIGHHIEELTEDNVNDAEISLNPANVMLVHHKCHNYIHNKFGYSKREIYIVYGAPLSGKTSYVESIREPGDLIIDLDNIWQCVSGCERYIKPNNLKSCVFKVRDTLLDLVKYRNGKWNNVYIIGGYPLISERERLVRELSAKEIYIECDRDECIRRLNALDDTDQRKIQKDDWLIYIDRWFEQYTPPGQ